MAISVTCGCGKVYSLKDELAGKLVKCPACGAQISVGGATELHSQGDPAFDRDKFLLRQKHLAISEKYYVWDEAGKAILFIERPAHAFRNFLAIFGGIACGIIFGVLFGMLAWVCKNEALEIILGIFAGAGGLVVCIIVAIMLSKKRDVYIYRDDTKTELLVTVFQDKKVQVINATYTVKDASGELLARLHKNYLYDIFRKRWYCHAPDGSITCVAMEDSIILSLMRRLLGPLFGVLRTNFVLLDGTGANNIGEFNRKFTLLDRYVLDMSADGTRAFDRRVAVALGVMLDTGERR